MKKFLLFSLLACFDLVASAQKVYFLYLQTEDFAPFYVRMADKIYSSATAGFLILPNLVDTTYYLSVGFAKSADPETKFSVAINGGDKGFLLKKFDDGLALFDFEQLSVVKSAASDKDNTVYETKTDAFSNVLAKAANDPSIVKVPVKKAEEPKLEKKKEKKEETAVAKIEEQKPPENTALQDSSVTQTASEKQTGIVVDSTVAKMADATAAVTQQAKSDTTTVQQLPAENKEEVVTSDEIAFKRSVVTRHSESSTTEGFGVIYFDKSDEAADTIRILIPSSKVNLAVSSDTTQATDLQTTNNKIDSAAPITKGEIDAKAAEAQTQTATEMPTLTKSNALCKNTATDKDFLKLRKRMAAGDTDEEMIDEAKKDFKSKCYSVEQVRYLSTLFLTSAAKYQFFDAAYEHVSDKSNFALLGSEIKDEYYAKRFKALVGE